MDPRTRVLNCNWRGLGESSVFTNGAAGDASITSGLPAVDWPTRTQGAVYFTPNVLASGPSGPFTWFGTLAENGAGSAGLLYKRNRYFDPASGRFTQADPIGLGGGLNLYGFANGDPVNYSDPFGLCPVPQLCLAAAGAILGGGGRVLFNLATDRPWSEGALETAIGGAMIGASFGAAAPEAATALFARGAGTAAARAVASAGATASALRLPDANKLSHVFDRAKHNWALTGLDQAGNLNLINNVAANASNLVSTTARNGGNILRYQGVTNGFNVVVNVFEKNGVRELSNSWIVK